MPINANEKGKKPSIHITEDDADNAEKLGKGNSSPSSVYSHALEKASDYEDLREELLQEIQNELNELKNRAEKLDAKPDELRFNLS